MVRLYLLGFTHDLKGVVFGQKRGGKTAAFWIPIDNSFFEAVDKLERAREEAGAKKGKGAKAKGKAAPARGKSVQKARVILPPVGRSQSSDAMPAAEIQQLLRQGRTVNSVVEVAKAPRAWVERLLEPVMTERGGIIRLAQRAQMIRPRLGRSGMQLGDAVIRNLEERRATTDTIEGLDDAWDARAGASGRWRVWVRFNHRGKRRTAEWEFRKDTRMVTPRNRLGAQLGWWPPEPDAVPEVIEGLEGETPAAEGEQPLRKPAKRRRTAKRRRPRKAAAKRSPKRKASTRRR